MNENKEVLTELSRGCI